MVWHFTSWLCSYGSKSLCHLVQVIVHGCRGQCRAPLHALIDVLHQFSLYTLLLRLTGLLRSHDPSSNFKHVVCQIGGPTADSLYQIVFTSELQSSREITPGRHCKQYMHVTSYANHTTPFYSSSSTLLSSILMAPKSCGQAARSC